MGGGWWVREVWVWECGRGFRGQVCVYTVGVSIMRARFFGGTLYYSFSGKGGHTNTVIRCLSQDSL